MMSLAHAAQLLGGEVSGPFVRDLDLTERVAQFRLLAGLVALICGSQNPAVHALRRADGRRE